MLKEMTLEEFADSTASEKAVPGGGSVSALAGSMAASLTAMVAKLTLKKEKFAHVAPQMESICQEADRLKIELMTAVDRDADSYREVLSAFRLPKETDEDKQKRSAAIQAAFKLAAQVPLKTAELALEVMDLAIKGIREGNPDMVTDAGVGMLMARAGVLGALMNVRINLTSIKDQALVAQMQEKTEQLKKSALEKEQAIFNALPL
ncbi:MAG: cyclodeaminase/cyclohydrolase family protein [Desulfobacteraceae bacterium]|nr:cyclodeaminase/cyclohydrolase family protein [Desulfobacteraceae bacterium]